MAAIQRAKFRLNRLNCGRDMVIFRFFKMERSKGSNCITMPNVVKIAQNAAEILRFFKMAAAAILDFQNFKFLTVRRVTSDELRHCAKFRRNRSKRGRDM